MIEMITRRQLEAEVDDWHGAMCVTCGRPFPRRDVRYSQCLVCRKVGQGGKIGLNDKIYLWFQKKLMVAVDKMAAQQKDPPESALWWLQRLESVQAELVATQQELDRVKEDASWVRGRMVAIAEERRQAREAAIPPLSTDMVRKMLFLCHPDRHDGSEKAAEVTKILLKMRGK